MGWWQEFSDPDELMQALERCEEQRDRWGRLAGELAAVLGCLAEEHPPAPPRQAAVTTLMAAGEVAGRAVMSGEFDVLREEIRAEWREPGAVEAALWSLWGDDPPWCRAMVDRRRKTNPVMAMLTG